MKIHRLSLLLAAMSAASFAVPSFAATKVMDFGPIATADDETVRLVVKESPIPVSLNGTPLVAAPSNPCSGRVNLSAGGPNGLWGSATGLFSALPGNPAVTLEFDPSRSAPPAGPNTYVTSAQVAYDAADTVSATACGKLLSSVVLVVDKGTGAIRRAYRDYKVIQ